MLFRRIVLLASRLRSIKGGLVAAIEDELENNDGEGDEDGVESGNIFLLK
jgi:hypothetical protein